MDLLVILPLVTFALVLVFALWSKVRTERKLEKSNKSTSSLARDTPDPNFQHDPEITDPYNVNDQR